MNKILIDKRLKSKIESFTNLGGEENSCFLLQFKDIEDSFTFDSETELYKFLNEQVSERFYDKELRKGYFDYISGENEILRYHIVVKRGSVVSYRDENLGDFECNGESN